ncbi:transposase [uncultured Paludibaculum sp.]|uniref:transposase n=1 Tax=uncultured Paludibaculum sp. TaxID=1765020 RepID=UPI002AABD73F|nr:transposase [uncultured Paludibaculum sp.]
MDLTPRQVLLQFGHVTQQRLFPVLEEELGPLCPQLKLLTSVAALIPLEQLLCARRAHTGRRPKDRAAMALAFIAKAVLNLPHTRDLIQRLRVDRALREICGWKSPQVLPHESKFSRAFALFAATQLPQQLHQAVVEATQGQRLIGHIARDSTAIPARERFPETPAQKARKKEEKKKEKQPQKKKSKTKPARPKRTKGAHARAKASERGTRIQRQRNQSLGDMLTGIPTECGIGAKKDSHGNERYWTGYKLHLDVADGQVPISAILTSASVHDSQLAIPLMTMTSERVTHLYELMDSAYDADAIHEHVRQSGRVPIIAPHARRGTKKPSKMPKVFPDKPTPELCWAKKDRFKERTMVERVNARLKDEFGASQIRVRGAVKVMAHLMFGVLALTVDQWMRLSG